MPQPATRRSLGLSLTSPRGDALRSGVIRTLIALVCSASLVGCAAEQRAALLVGGPASMPNLALGPSPDGLVAAQFIGRSGWPAVETGYRIGEFEEFTDAFIDDQYQYDRNGGFYRFGQTIRTGVFLR
jgi:hypothetical protein